MNLAYAVFVSLLLAAGAANADDAQELLHKYKCYICHADNEPKAGPSYADVAAAYRGHPNAASTLSAVIKQGARSGGPWHMPPHPEVSDAEARKMARYILSLKN